MLLVENNVVQKIRKLFNSTISLYKTNLKQINDKKNIILVTTHFLYDIVYQKQHKSRESNACSSV